MPSQSSWHPAFMPNSAADVISTGPLETSQSIPTHGPVLVLEPSKPDPTGPSSDRDDSASATSDLEENVANGESLEEGNKEHHELTNLRNALSTSLASPGGVELDENPLHTDISKNDAIVEEKANFPSKGPNTPNKHLSTTSFARTVSQDVNWGEDDEVDPEFNFHRTDDDPFNLMPKSDRSNSFPQVPPAHSPAIVSEEHHSQAEDILNEMEKAPKDLFGDDDNNEVDFFTQQSAPHDDANEFLQGPYGAMNNGGRDYRQTYGGEFQQEDEQSRFEEGLPLVQSPENRPAEHTKNQPAFIDNATEAQDDFFSQLSTMDQAPYEQFPGRQPLERKSTMEVMNSLHYPSQEQISEEHIIESSQSFLESATARGMTVLTGTSLSQAPGFPDDSTYDQPEGLEALDMESSEGDLAEKWKAALAADEFLVDDDELLADDEPIQSATLDPASLFSSDDEGFLEDTENQDASAYPFSQQSGPSIPTPVTNLNDPGIGFSNLTGPAQTRASSSGSNRYLPSDVATNSASSKPFAPSAPLLTDLSRPATASAVPSYTAPAFGNFPVEQQQRQDLPKAQSFADKSKGGYSSPYDLPMEVVKPRKRVSMQQMRVGSTPSTNAPPPRASSMYAQPPPLSRGSTSGQSPPTSSHSFQQNQLQSGLSLDGPQLPKTVKKSASGFFEDLPVSSKPKPAARHSTGLNSTGQMPYAPPNNPPPQFLGASPLPPYVPQVQQPPSQPSPAQGLIAPERVSAYAPLLSNHVAAPPITSRYSPAPQQHSQGAPPPPVSQSRYSHAPLSSRPLAGAYAAPIANAPPVMALAHQPRTSSPLAHFERNHGQRTYGSQAETTSHDRRSGSSDYESAVKLNHLPPTREVEENDQAPANERAYRDGPQQYAQYPISPHIPGTQSISRTPPPPQGYAARTGISPPKRAASNNLPSQHSSTIPTEAFVPPQRSQTHSPASAFAGPRLDINATDHYQRPASVEAPSPTRNSEHSSMPVSLGRPRGFSQGLSYIAPKDGRENDPMQRWRGAPVFIWGVGGTLVTSFPKDIPRYGMNQPAPMILRSPGEIKIRNIKDIDTLPERLASFPGPLKGKSKKKEVVSWLTSGIEMLEHNASYLRSVPNYSYEDKRAEERILLWKILRVFIENDGTLEGNPSVAKAVRAVLSPGIDDDTSDGTPIYATGADLSSGSESSVTRADPVDPGAVDRLRRHLLRGDREKAVWEAVDKRLWAHAMLISNTVSKELYKQVAQEFVQKEVKIIGDNAEPLAALYEIFAGNFEESIDELVPPSARAGFQMVSTSSASGPSKDALDGLNRWRETLGLVLSNRSTDDNQALNALGKLLSGYGRADAAHICFLFARAHSVFGGIDDPLASIVLVGSDHLRQPHDFDKEMEPILLSEVFEYGMSMSSTSTSAMSSPHLSIYKLQHATILAEYGYREKALQYCESIAASITSQTRRSPYHHALLVAALDDLSKRLKQSPKDESSSWISKPSIDKVSGSVWATFNKFVAGDDTDSASPGYATGSMAEVGPFARIAGGTPTISRSPSEADIYGTYNGSLSINGAMAATQATKNSSRYAPGGSHSPPTHDPQLGTSYGSHPRGSFEDRSSNEYRRRSHEPPQRMSDYQPDSRPTVNNYTPQTNSTYTPHPSYAPLGTASTHTETASPYARYQSAPVIEPPRATLYSSPEPVSTYDGQQPSSSYMSPETSYEPQQFGSENHSGGQYEPSTASGYEPPSFQPPSFEPPSFEPPSFEPASFEPPSMNEPDSPISGPPKRSFMDDDEVGDSAALTNSSAGKPAEKTKAEKDREADEAFRKAAEADAAKASEAQPAKKGWGLGGWFGGAAKKENGAAAQPNKPIRAKLGEASSFVYDTELKRWVNKKAGAAEDNPSRSATPPPPKAGPPRTVSGPTSAPRVWMETPQRSASILSDVDGALQDAARSLQLPSVMPPMRRSSSNGSMSWAPPSRPGTSVSWAAGPPSRPGTSMSNASSIDDLIGPPNAAGGRKGTAKKSKKGRGYVDVMG